MRFECFRLRPGRQYNAEIKQKENAYKEVENKWLAMLQEKTKYCGVLEAYEMRSTVLVTCLPSIQNLETRLVLAYDFSKDPVTVSWLQGRKGTLEGSSGRNHNDHQAKFKEGTREASVSDPSLPTSPPPQ